MLLIGCDDSITGKVNDSWFPRTASRISILPFGTLNAHCGSTSLVTQGNAEAGLQKLLHSLSIFQDLARKAPASNYLSYKFGNAYSQIAGAHVVLASRPNLHHAQQIEHWREARSWYQKSLAVWLDLKYQGKLGGEEVGEPERLPQEITKCDKAPCASATLEQSRFEKMKREFSGWPLWRVSWAARYDW